MEIETETKHKARQEAVGRKVEEAIKVSKVKTSTANIAQYKTDIIGLSKNILYMAKTSKKMIIKIKHRP